MSVAVGVYLPWVTRRCAVTRTRLTPVPFVNACMDWLQFSRDLLANRLRWVYHATLWSETPRETKREARSSGYPFLPTPTASKAKVDLSAYGGGSGTEPGVFGAGAASALANMFDFPDSDSEDDADDDNVVTVVDEAEDAAAHVVPKFVYKAARTLAPSAGMRAFLFTSSSELPVPKPQIAPILSDVTSSRGPTLAVGGAATNALAPEDEAGFEIVQASAAAQVLYSVLEETLCPEATFVCGVRTCRQLLNDYRELHNAYGRAARTRMKKEYIRERKRRLEAGETVPEPPDFDQLISKQPHWSAVRVERGVAGVMVLVEEVLSVHSQLLGIDGDTRPVERTRANPLSGGPSAPSAKDSAVLTRQARLTSLINSIHEGFTI